SSNANASVGASSGVVTGVTAGNSTITYKLGTGCIATSVVTVNPLPAAITGANAVCLGLTTSLSSTTSGGTWSSSNGNATIDASTGVVTGSTAGNSTITYMLNTGCIATMAMTVNPLPNPITGTAILCAGLTTSLSSSPGAGTWSSSSTANATIGATTGVVTA